MAGADVSLTTFIAPFVLVGDRMNTMADRTGATTKFYRKQVILRTWAKPISNRLNRRSKIKSGFVSRKKGSKKVLDVYKRLGITVSDFEKLVSEESLKLCAPGWNQYKIRRN